MSTVNHCFDEIFQTCFLYFLVKIFHVHLDLFAHLGHLMLVSTCVQLVLTIHMESHQQMQHVYLVHQVANLLLSEGRQAIYK